MGYYDDHNLDPSEPNRSGGRRRGRGGWFLAGLLGAIVGIVVFLVFAPVLSNLGVLPYAVETGGNTTNTTSPGSTKQVNVDVTSGVTKAVDKVSPAVVTVINLKRANFFDNKYQKTGIGSGIIYKKSDGGAYIVTNNHVVEGANKVEVRLSNDVKVDAQVLGKDSLYDLAVLKIPGDKVKEVAQFGDSSKLKRGEPVIAIGNPLGFNGSVTEGIVSAPNRMIPVQHDNVSMQAQVIQTDAAINPGNSGGALVNIEGQVIGINSLKIAEQTVEGIGFAIPINVAKPVIKQLEKQGKIERPYLGIGIVDLNNVPTNALQQLKIPDNVHTGLVATEVKDGSPAARGGLKAGDVITEINGKKIQSYIKFSTYLYTQLKPDQTVDVTYYRFGKKHTTKIKLGDKVFS
ncbi:serine protease Do [Scopulibacillus darangshiensis]|uniref:Serine protease Do n=1 Tax=Scopulibacillus darangshiensis TaxID=442528 RepID=A0A4R2NP62_9BACL|nr:trypsin-like peptidase domain-containing protein [Scopulibacillus darangshiensis]TCP23432.1 serine protease Do [Scopulibacillus darangshiensis]